MLISITDIILQSIALYKQNIQRFVTYALFIFVPGAFITICSAVLPILVPSTFTIGVLGASYLLYIGISIILSLISFWFSIAFIRVIAKTYAGTAVQSIATELHEAKVTFWPALVVSILTVLVVFGGMLLLIIPGIIFGLWFAFSIYAATIDHEPPVQAMKTSKQLVDGRWWAVFWRLVIPSLAFGIVIVAIQALSELPLQFVLENTNTKSLLYISWGVVAELIVSLIALLLAPFTTAIPTILYIELKKQSVIEQNPPQMAQ